MDITLKVTLKRRHGAEADPHEITERLTQVMPGAIDVVNGDARDYLTFYTIEDVEVVDVRGE